MRLPTSCRNCGAALEAGVQAPIVCRFCDARNEALPDEVEVPVPVQIVHNVVNVIGERVPEGTGERRCPHCRQRLVTVRTGEVDLSGCGRCGGIWVDNASAKRLLLSPKQIFVELGDRASANASQRSRPRATTPVCPDCPVVLEPTKTHGMDLDVCPEHGTWFDTYELQRLVRSLLKSPEPLEYPNAYKLPTDAVNAELHVQAHRELLEKQAADQMLPRTANAVGGFMLSVLEGVLLGRRPRP